MHHTKDMCKGETPELQRLFVSLVKHKHCSSFISHAGTKILASYQSYCTAMAEKSLSIRQQVVE